MPLRSIRSLTPRPDAPPEPASVAMTSAGLGPSSAPGTPPDSLAERFVALYQREYVALARMAELLIGNRAIAEEVVQDVFAEVFRRWQHLHGEPSMGAYLNRSVLNRCRSHFRSAERGEHRRAVHERPPGMDPVDTVLTNAATSELRYALGTLPRRQRECVVAHFLLEQTESETAAMLDISIGSVRTHTRRGVQALRKAMARP